MNEQERETKIRLWFEMWLLQKDLGIDEIFAEDVVYTESWGPQYEGAAAVKHWFEEWNARGRVLVWDIRQFSLLSVLHSTAGSPPFASGKMYSIFIFR